MSSQEEPEESEYGAGLALNLAKFMEHFKVPDKWKGSGLDTIVHELRELGLDIGHGDGLMGRRIYGFAEFKRLHQLALEAANELDKMIWTVLGETTQLDVGQW
jgi:hypothetical protein